MAAPSETLRTESDVGRENKPGRNAASAGLAGMLWFAGWLFTAAFAKLVWWKVRLGLAIWPYFLGQVVR